MENISAAECFGCRRLTDAEIEERGLRPRPGSPFKELMEMLLKESRELPIEIRERIREISEQGTRPTPDELS